MLRWECVIPGPDKTDWAGGFFPLTLEFSEEYPVKPPKVCPPCLSPRLCAAVRMLAWADLLHAHACVPGSASLARASGAAVRTRV